MTVRVRPASKEDFPAVAALLEELGRPKVLGTPDEPEHRARFAELIEAPDLFGLVAEAEVLASEHGAFALTLESANWRTRAHAFYVRQGMQDAAKHFIKPLDDVGYPPPPEEG
jgi:hypothetical protein